MPLYTYRRDDGTTFEVKQGFHDAPLTLDPHTGQKVVRVVHAAGIIFKGSGFYINDSKSGSKSSLNGTSKPAEAKAEAKTENAGEAKAEPKPETKTESKPAPSAAAAD